MTVNEDQSAERVIRSPTTGPSVPISVTPKYGDTRAWEMGEVELLG